MKRLRIIVCFFEEYFDTIASFDAYNSKVNAESSNQDQEEGEEDDVDEDDEDVEEIISSPVKQIQKTTSQVNKNNQFNDRIIRSPDYYKSMQREISLMIFQHHCMRLLSLTDQLTWDQLSPKERILVTVYEKFALKKNFYSNQKWSKIDTNLVLSEYPRCDLCASKFDPATSLDLSRIECESGHVMSRCQKTLFPLNNFKYQKCYACYSVWNVMGVKDFPNFSTIFNESCLYCN